MEQYYEYDPYHDPRSRPRSQYDARSRDPRSQLIGSREPTLDEKIRKNEQDIETFKKELLDNPTVQAIQTRVGQELLQSQRHLADLKRRKAVQQAERTQVSISDRTKTNKNPPIDILINLYIDGKHIVPENKEYMRIDTNLNLHSTKKEINRSEIAQLRSHIQMLQAHGATTSTREMAQYVQLLAEAELPFKPHFYVALGDIKSLVDIAQFTSSYRGENRSYEKVEANIDVLLKILFDRKELKVDGKMFRIVSYSWKKNVFPPYGYQTGRGTVQVRTLEKTFSLITTEFKIQDQMTFINPPLEHADTSGNCIALERAIEGLLTDYDPEKAVKQYSGTPLNKNNICLNNHRTVFVTPDLVHSLRKAESRAQAFIYDYLAYRCSIYHNFFAPDVWTIYSQIPYFVSLKKNSVLVERLIKLAPNEEIKKHTQDLYNYWLKHDETFYNRAAKIQLATQQMFLRRMFFQIQHRIQYMRLALNYTVLQVILKETIRCITDVKQKDFSINCLSTVVRENTKYFKKPTQDQAEVPSVNSENNVGCPGVAVVNATTPLIDVINGAAFKMNGDDVDDNPTDLDVDFDFPDDEAKTVNLITFFNDLLNDEKQKPAVRRYVSLHHELPPKHACVFKHIQLLQLHKLRLEINTLTTMFTSEKAKMTTTEKEINLIIEESCLGSVQDVIDGKDCVDKLTKAYAAISGAGANFSKRVVTRDDDGAYHILDEKYDEWYAPLDEVQARYKDTFLGMSKAVRDLGELMVEIQKSDDNYNRRINQLDYAIDAFAVLSKINLYPALDPIDIPKQCTPEKDVVKRNTYLNTLYDLLDNKLTRGVVWYVDFVYERETKCDLNVDQRARLQQLIQGINFTENFAKLEPDCIIDYISVNFNDAHLAKQLYTHATHLLKKGYFVEGIESVHLACMFKIRSDKWIKLLKFMLETTDRKVEAKRLSKDTKTEDLQKWFRKYYKKEPAERIHHILYSNESNVYVNDATKTLLKMFDQHVNPKHEEYRNALVHFACLQAASTSVNAQHIFEHEFTANEIKKILKYFPKTYILSKIVAQIYETMHVNDWDAAYTYVAEKMVKFGKIGRKALENDVKCTRIDIDPTMLKLAKNQSDIQLCAMYTNQAVAERENDWPNKLESDGMFGQATKVLKMANRAVPYPYVDGNYSLRVVVDLRLTTRDENAKSPESCEDKYTEAVNLYDTLMSN